MRLARLTSTLALLASFAFLASVADAQDGPEPELAGQAEEQQGDPEPPLVELTPEEQLAAEEASHVAAQEIVSEDAARAKRLTSILRAVDEFDGIQVDVRAGVVRLFGTARTQGAADGAVELAEKLDGTLLVLDDLHVDRGLLRRLGTGFDSLLAVLRSAFEALPLLIAAGLVLVGAIIVGRWLRELPFGYGWLTKKVLLQNLIRQSVFAGVIVLGIVGALSLLDATALLGTILGAAGVAGLALGFAFRDIVENYLSGILLALRQPFTAHDYVDINGQAGTVMRMTPSETVLMTADGNHLRLPNASIFKGVVLNYSRNPLRRFTISVGIGVDEDLVRAQTIGVEVLSEMKGVLDDPAPSSRIRELGDSAVQIDFYGWVDQHEASFVKVSSEAVRLVKTRLDDAQIDMPIPAYEVKVKGPLDVSEAPKEAAAAKKPSATKPPGKRPPAKKPDREAEHDAGPAPEDIDVTPHDDVTQQIERENRASVDENLLEESSTS